ncbi:MAG: hypothetical protein ACPGXK_05330 [Phycisphaerae bacterium]
MPKLTMPEFVLDLHVLATLCMVGLIWFVQVVHYPLMAKVGADGYAAYQTSHMSRTTIVVAPLMLLEAATACFLLVMPGMQGRWLPIIGMILLLVIWLSTALLQVPCHQRLEKDFDSAIVDRLVLSNWIRTLAWTVRGGIALYLARWATS